MDHFMFEVHFSLPQTISNSLLNFFSLAVHYHSNQSTCSATLLITYNNSNDNNYTFRPNKKLILNLMLTIIQIKKMNSRLLNNFYAILLLLLLLSLFIDQSYQAQVKPVRLLGENPKNRIPNNITRSFCQYPGANSFKLGEFYKLPSLVTPNKYRLRFRINSRREKLFGHSMITVHIHNQTNMIELNAVKLVVNGAFFQTKNIRGKFNQFVFFLFCLLLLYILSVNVSTVYNCPEKETIVLHFYKPLHKGIGNLTITFSGNLTEMIHSGFVKANKDEKFVMTDFGPTDARRNFPCWDEPRFKAQFEIYLIIPQNNYAIFNLPSIRRRPYSIELEEVRFETTPLFSTFQLATLFGSKFQITSNKPKMNNTLNEILVQIYSPISHNTDEWLYALETSEKLFNFYQYYFDKKYPLKKLDLVALNNYEQTSMEKLGLIIFEEKQLLIINRTDASEEEFNSVAQILAHSLAHQWVGNLVIFQEWNEFWLFEALALFMEKEALASLFPHWRTWERFASDEFRRALLTDSSRYSIPLEKMIKRPNDILQLYPSENRYFKVVALFRMLRSSIGEEVKLLFYKITNASYC